MLGMLYMLVCLRKKDSAVCVVCVVCSCVFFGEPPHRRKFSLLAFFFFLPDRVGDRIMYAGRGYVFNHMWSIV